MSNVNPIEADDTFDCSEFGADTGCSIVQHEAAKRLRAALAAFGRQG